MASVFLTHARRRLSLAASTVVIATLVGASPALAQDAPGAAPEATPEAAAPAPVAATEGDIQAAKNNFDDGQNLYLLGKFEAAAEKFLKAYQIKPYPAFIFNVAVCLEKNNDFQKALKFYERFVKEDPHSQDRKLVETRIAALRRHLERKAQPPVDGQPASQPVAPNLPPIDPKGLVVIESTPEGAAIYLNSKKNGIFTRTPYTGSLPPGMHTAIVELKDYRSERKTFTVRNDRLTYLFFGLSVEKNLGWIEVKANIPGAEVFIDQKEVGAVGRTPYSGNQRPGKRKIIVERVGYEPVVREIDIIAGKTHTLNIKLTKVEYGWLKVTGKTTKGAMVKVDGKPVKCEDYPCRSQLRVGTHHVVLERDGFKDYEHTIEVERANEVKLAVRLEPSPPRIKAYVTLGVAAAFLTGAIITGVMSSNRKSALEDDINGGGFVDSDDSRFSEGKWLAVGADIGFALSGVAAALGVYYLFRNEGPDSFGESDSKNLAAGRRNLAITPTFGPDTAGITGSLRF